MLEGFEEELDGITRNAELKLAAYLGRRLSTTNGVIDRTPDNFRVIRNLDNQFLTYLDDAGYEGLLNSFSDHFMAGQKVFLDDTLDHLGLPRIGFSPGDMKIFSAFRLNTVASIEAVAEMGARQASQQAMLSVGGLKFDSLVETLRQKTGASAKQSVSLANTAMSTWYRTMTDISFQKIEQDLPEDEQRYFYNGPEDRITRPFCRHLLDSAKNTPYEGWTRAEIDRMNNGQIPNVFVSGGGWNCRHTFLLTLAKRPA